MRTKPWKHQLREYLASRALKARALLWGMRTGKTKVVVDTAFWLHGQKRIKGMIVFAPNGVHLNWITRELPKHAWEDYRGVAWRSAFARHRNERFLRMLESVCDPKAEELRIFAVNVEILHLKPIRKALGRFLRSCEYKVLLVADECHAFRRAGAKKTGFIRGFSRLCPYKRILSGTAVLNSPIHAFSQFEILEKKALGFGTLKSMKLKYCIMERARFRGKQGVRFFNKVVGYKDLPDLRLRMAKWSSVVLREDVDDMPTLLQTERPVEMSAAQEAAYRRLLKDAILELEDRDLPVLRGGPLRTKLHQITGGFFIDDRGEVVDVDPSPPILDALVDEVEGALPNKMIVWCRFREDIRRVVERLRRQGYSPVQIHGGVSEGKRAEALRRFREDPTCTILVGQPAVGGQGLDLSTASTIIWYTSVQDGIITAQANERATAKGGGTVTIVTITTPGTVDDDIRLSNAGKVKLADTISGVGLRDLLLRMQG